MTLKEMREALDSRLVFPSNYFNHLLPTVGSLQETRAAIARWQKEGLMPALDGGILVWKYVTPQGQYPDLYEGVNKAIYMLGRRFCIRNAMACAGPIGAATGYIPLPVVQDAEPELTLRVPILIRLKSITKREAIKQFAPGLKRNGFDLRRVRFKVEKDGALCFHQPARPAKCIPHSGLVMAIVADPDHLHVAGGEAEGVFYCEEGTPIAVYRCRRIDPETIEWYLRGGSDVRALIGKP